MRAFFLISSLLISQALLAGNDNLKFIENKGQLKNSEGKPANDILFYADAGDVRYVIRSTGITYLINERPEWEEYEEHEEREKRRHNRAVEKGKIRKTPGFVEGLDEFKLWRVDMNWLNASQEPIVEGIESNQAKFNYYTPDFPAGLLGVTSYNKVLIKNVYENIDVLFYSKGSQFKYDYIIHRNGDISKIKFVFEGARHVRLEQDTLVVKTPYGLVKDFIPQSVIEKEGIQKNVRMHFQQTVDKSWSIVSEQKLGDFEKLIVDPATWVTYLGGTGQEFAYDIESDSSGNIYITGAVDSPDFPVTPGAFQTTMASSSFNSTGFLTKMSPAGDVLWSTYYGGTGYDNSFGVTVDAANFVYMCGYATSTDFPVTAGAFQTTYGGDGDGFLVKFDEFGVRQWATYIGGTGYDLAYKVDVDQVGDVWLVGSSSSGDYPVLLAYQPALSGSSDAIITKFSPAGSLLYSTYLGGSSYDDATDVDVTTGYIGVVGSTQSPTFPFTSDAWETTVTVDEGFYSKFDLTGSLVYSTAYGGSAIETPSSIQFDGMAEAVIAGTTWSSDYPTTPGAYQTVTGGGVIDCFMIKFHADNSIYWSTYYGNTYMEYEAGVTIDNANNIYLFSEWEDDAFVDLPVLGCAFQKEFGGTEDQFIVKWSPSCEKLCMTYLGGSMEDDLDGITAPIEWSKGFLYTTCYSFGDYPVTPGAYQTTLSGFIDIGLARLCSVGCGDTISTKADFTINDTVCMSYPVNFHATSASCDTNLVTYLWDFPGGVPSSSTSKDVSVSYSTTGTYTATLTAFSPCDTATKVMSFLVTVGGTTSANITASTDSICPNTPIIFTVSTSGASGPFNYTWSVSPLDTSSIAFSPVSSGYITVTVSGSGSNCPGSDSIFINVLPIPLILSPADTCICNGASLVLTASGTPSYLWSTSETTASITVSPTVNTIYTVSYSNGICTVSDTTNVCVNALPTAAIVATTDSICVGTPVTFTAVPGGASPFVYAWSGIIGGTTISVSGSPGGSGTQTLFLTDANGCSTSAAASLTVFPVPNIVAPADTCICQGAVLNLAASGTPGYNWNTGATTASITVAPSTTFTYIVSYSNGICADDDSVTVCVNPVPVVIASNDTSIAYESSASLYVTGGGPFTWSPSNTLSCSACNNPEATPSETTTYIVSSTNAFGCKASDEVTVTIYYLLIIPNIITPNQDGMNDNFRILGLPPHSYISIYNRWGNQLHETDDYKNDWSTITDGVYYYVLKTPDGKYYKGFFHVNKG
ncbi:MAG TPA: gliding motility-associated C-terminal domain-containing protein [Flavobacteriales bacterium]|nr:gliding motility-associated C-terminal domain-containing protein [Flavobacteriales bacterium]